jgi:tRNA(Ile)-lysidine synthase
MAGEAFTDKLARNWPPAGWRDVTVVLAVSGGPDSVALLRATQTLAAGGAGRVVAAHYHHGLRAEEADLDARFVARLCAELALECVTRRAAPQALTATKGGSLEAAARKARYRFLRATAQSAGARFVATGHTADDQAETILHRILRGTGLSGLGGIPRARPLTTGVTLIRPLLAFRRTEILEYLRSLGQAFREDSSNEDPQFTRNRLRHKLLPRIAADFNPDVVAALVRLGSLARESQSLTDRLADELAERCDVRRQGSMVELDCRPLCEAEPLLVRAMLAGIWQQQDWPLRDMSYEKWSSLAAMAQAAAPQRAAQVLPGAIRAERSDHRLRLMRSPLAKSADCS